jgi:predicted GIY-YIG superfamily endonuclease
MKTYLYRHFGDGNLLLYVGISLDAIERTSQHKEGAAWWELIRTITIEKFETREEALAAERKAIREEKPLHNIHHQEVAVEVQDSEFAIMIRESAYVPNCFQNGTSWRVKWRNFLGEKLDADFATAEEALSLVEKLKNKKNKETEVEEKFIFANYGE